MWNISRKLSLLFIFDVSSPWKKKGKKEKRGGGGGGEEKRKDEKKKGRKWDRKNNEMRTCEFFLSYFCGFMYARNIPKWWKKHLITKEIFLLPLDKFRFENNMMTGLINIVNNVNINVFHINEFIFYKL